MNTLNPNVLFFYSDECWLTSPNQTNLSDCHFQGFSRAIFKFYQIKVLSRLWIKKTKIQAHCRYSRPHTNPVCRVYQTIIQKEYSMFSTWHFNFYFPNMLTSQQQLLFSQHVDITETWQIGRGTQSVYFYPRQVLTHSTSNHYPAKISEMHFNTSFWNAFLGDRPLCHLLRAAMGQR